MAARKRDSAMSRALRFFTHDLWELDLGQASRVKRWLVDTVRTLVIVVRGFIEDQLLLRASALTYSTLLALVPLFALAFAVLKGLGAQNEIQAWLLEQVGPSQSLHNTIEKIFAYVDQANLRALGAVGLIFLVFTAVSMISNVEYSLNKIWGVKTARSWMRRFADYLSALVLGPIVLFATINLTVAVANPSLAFRDSVAGIPVVGWIVETFGIVLPVLGRIIPFLIMWAFFTFLYFFLPNTKVKFIPSLLAGLFAGVAWQIMQWIYIEFQVGVAKYNALYGTLAQLPILMLWIYLSWVVFLLGAELAFAMQNRKTIVHEHGAGYYSFAERQKLALRLMLAIGRNFISGLPPLSMQHLAQLTKAPVRLINDTLFILREGSLVVFSAENSDACALLAKDVDSIELYDIFAILAKHPGNDSMNNKDSYVGNLLTKLQDSQRNSLKNVTLRQAIEQAANEV